MSTPSLKLLVLKSPSLEQLLPFYEALGIAFQREQHGNGPVHYSATLGEVVLELYPLADDAAPDTTTRLGIKVADLSAVLAKLANLGMTASAPRDAGWGLRTVVQDPDGRTVELHQ
jgi:hypothetical protein